MRVKAEEGEKTVDVRPSSPKDNAAKKFKALLGDKPEILSVEWTHRHYVQDDEYIPHGEDIEAFLKREIAKPIIRWEDSPQLGYEILPNKYFYRYQPPTPAKELLAEFWKLEKEAEKMLEGLANDERLSQTTQNLQRRRCGAVDRIKRLTLAKIGSGVTPSDGAASYLDAGIPLLRSQNVHSNGCDSTTWHTSPRNS